MSASGRSANTPGEEISFWPAARGGKVGSGGQRKPSGRETQVLAAAISQRAVSWWQRKAGCWRQLL